MSSRLEDLRDLARMLDEGKISQSEYDQVKTELLEAPADDWEQSVEVGPPGDDENESVDRESVASWRRTFDQIPTTYRVAAVGAMVVAIVGFFLGGNGDAAGSVTVDRASLASAPSGPAPESLGIVLDGLAEGWNAVPDPPLIAGGVITSPEAGPLDSFLHNFDGSAVIAGAYDPSDGSVYALMAKASLQDGSVSSLYVHLCFLLHPGSQGCLDSFIEETGLFGKAHSELAETERTAAWQFEGHQWELSIASDVETIRVQSASSP